MNLDVAIQAIKDSEGIPVLAHPLSLYVSWGKIEGVLTDLKERGICGLEAWHSGVRLSEAKRLEELARKLGFFVTAGSDFHGEKVRADRKIGHTAGGLKIDSRFWQDELSVQLNQPRRELCSTTMMRSRRCLKRQRTAISRPLTHCLRSTCPSSTIVFRPYAPNTAR